MKNIIGIFIVVLISVAAADFIQGVVLTFIYTPDLYSTSGVEMADFLKYTIYATVFVKIVVAFHLFVSVILIEGRNYRASLAGLLMMEQSSRSVPS